MKYTFEYANQEDRETIINNNQDKYLIEEKNIKEGNFLIFTDAKPIELEIENIKQKQSIQDSVIEEILFDIIPTLGGV